jgi:hypothetical protein
MTAATRIFLGDLVRALHDAGSPGGENWEEIASLLGMTRSASDARPTLPPRQPERPPLQEGSQTRAAVGTQASSPTPAQADIGQLVEFEFSQSTTRAESLPTMPASQVELRSTPNPTIQPLLSPLWERGILLEAVSTPIRQGDINILETVELIARGRSLEHPPREVISSVSKGCHVLIDLGVGMQPFAEDALQLVNSVKRSVGSDHTKVFTFVDCPSLGVLTESFEDTRYFPPENGAIVLALSDLCNGGPRVAMRDATPADWLTVAKRIRDAGSALVILNPYPPARWPASIAERIPILFWDRSTRTASVRRARRMRRS